MPKIVLVKNITKCDECPHMMGFATSPKVEKYCKKTPDIKYIEDGETIPAWCPLPEDKEQFPMLFK
jgi:hypothetical protein